MSATARKATVTVTTPSEFVHKSVEHKIAGRARVAAERIVHTLDVCDDERVDWGELERRNGIVVEWLGALRAAGDAGPCASFTMARKLAKAIGEDGVESHRTRISDGADDYIPECEALIFFSLLAGFDEEAAG